MSNARPAPGASKADWRAWAAGQPVPSPEAARQVQAHLADLLETDLARAGKIAAYLALPGEVPLDLLIEGHAHRIALPRVASVGLTFHDADAAREVHRAVEQPVASATRVPLRSVSVMLIPGRVFDRRGVRLGLGAGHYDRTLGATSFSGPRIGVTIESRVVDELPVEPHDVTMTHLATEEGVRAVSG